MLRFLPACVIVFFLFGCAERSPDELKSELNRLRKEKAEAEARRKAAEEKLQAYKLDLEHQRFLVAQLREKVKRLERKIAELEQASKLGEIVSRIEAVQLDRRIGRQPEAENAPAASAAVSSAPKPESKPKPSEVTTPNKPGVAVESRKPPVAVSTIRAKPRTTEEKSKPAVTVAKPRVASAAQPEPRPEFRASPPPIEPVPSQPAATKVSTPVSSSGKDLRLVDVVESIAGGKIRIAGFVANNTSDPIVDARVTVLFYGDGGETIKKVSVRPQGEGRIAPRSRVPFEIVTSFEGRIKGYKLNVSGMQRIRAKGD